MKRSFCHGSQGKWPKTIWQAAYGYHIKIFLYGTLYHKKNTIFQKARALFFILTVPLVGEVMRERIFNRVLFLALFLPIIPIVNHPKAVHFGEVFDLNGCVGHLV
jgi:hypothetical protein